MPSTLPLVIAHRGASREAPENTLAAFQLAWQRQADGIEGDFRLTADGEIVCIHDDTTTRTAGKELRVCEATLDDLKQLDVGGWKGSAWTGERIATLAEVLAIVPSDKQLFIEVKCGPEIVTPLERAISASSVSPAQLSVIAFDARVIVAMRERMPAVQANWLSEVRRDSPDDPWRPQPAEIVEVLDQIGTCGVGLEANLAAIDESYVAPLHAHDIELHVWTVDDPQAARRFAALGFRSLTTNVPDIVKAAISN